MSQKRSAALRYEYCTRTFGNVKAGAVGSTPPALSPQPRAKACSCKSNGRLREVRSTRTLYCTIRVLRARFGPFLAQPGPQEMTECWRRGLLHGSSWPGVTVIRRPWNALDLIGSGRTSIWTPSGRCAGGMAAFSARSPSWQSFVTGLRCANEMNVVSGCSNARRQATWICVDRPREARRTSHRIYDDLRWAAKDSLVNIGPMQS